MIPGPGQPPELGDTVLSDKNNRQRRIDGTGTPEAESGVDGSHLEFADEIVSRRSHREKGHQETEKGRPDPPLPESGGVVAAERTVGTRGKGPDRDRGRAAFPHYCACSGSSFQ